MIKIFQINPSWTKSVNLPTSNVNLIQITASQIFVGQAQRLYVCVIGQIEASVIDDHITNRLKTSEIIMCSKCHLNREIAKP